MIRVYIRQLRDKAKDQVVELVKTDDIKPINKYRQPPFEAVANLNNEFVSSLPTLNKIQRYYVNQFIDLFGVEPGEVQTEEKIEANRKRIIQRAKEVLNDLKEQNEEEKLFDEFQEADEGIFDGFEFADEFHKHINKEEALHHLQSNIDGYCKGIDVGREYVDVYFFCDPKKAKKQVRFNRSVYVF